MCKERLEIIKKLRETILEENDFRTRCVLAYAFVNLGYMDWLIGQAERVQELEKRIKELEYASKYNGKLNEFLQKRKLPPNTLGRHVVEVVMDYVEELEQQNKRYREAIEFGIEYLKNSDIRQVQLVVTALKSALEESE